MNKSNEITIGWPTNTRLAKDLEPLRNAMQLESTEPGVLRTPQFPEARFRELRTQDIAYILENQRFRTDMILGIIGTDTMTERRMVNRRGSAALWNKTRCLLEIGTPPSELRVLVREEDVEEDRYLRQRSGDETRVKKIISSYPSITERAVIDPFCYGDYGRLGDDIGFFRCNLAPIFPVEGRIESMLRNQDIPDTLAAVDVVRTGVTAATFGLKALGAPVLISYPGLYSLGVNPKTNTAACVDDFISFFRAALTAAEIPELVPRDSDRIRGGDRNPFQLYRFPRNPSPSFDLEDERRAGEYF